MRFLLDENIPKTIAVALRSEGHDVTRVQETPLRGAGDDAILDYAQRDARIFVTADTGIPLFGTRPAGVLLIRGFQRVSIDTLERLMTDAVRSLGEDILGRLVVLSPGRLRTRDL